MTDEQKSTKKEFRSCCEGMDFAKMMRKMMRQREENHGFDGPEMMQKMMDQESECCDFDCSEMMARMTTMCCQQQE
jgi:hypothetical protein